MKYCAKCGNANADEAVFCSSCGSPLEQAPAAPQQSAAPAPEPAAYSAPAPQPQQPAYTAPAYDTSSAYTAPAAPADGEVKNKATLWLILNIVATVLCCPSSLFGILGIIFAAIGMGSYKKGDYDDMNKKSKIAMIMFIVAAVLGVILWIIVAAAGIIPAIIAASEGYY